MLSNNAINDIANISPEEANEQIQAGTARLVDVREEEEYNAAHIADTPLAPLSRFNLQDRIWHQDPEKLLIIHCKSGKRSRQVCELMALHGHAVRTTNLDGGIEAWQTAGLPTS